MKNKPLKLRLSYSFRQQIHGKDSLGNMPELVEPESEGEKAESVIRDILRWADDGGKMMDLGNQTTKSDAAPKWANEL